MGEEVDVYLIDIGKRLSDYLEQRKLITLKPHIDLRVRKGVMKKGHRIVGDFFFYASLCPTKHVEKTAFDRYGWVCEQTESICRLRWCPKVLKGQTIRKKSKKVIKKP